MASGRVSAQPHQSSNGHHEGGHYLEAGEEFQWQLADRDTLSVHRLEPAKANSTRVKAKAPNTK